MGGILCHVLVTVMVGRIKLSFHHRVFILLLTFCWVLVGTFMVFQYFREKEFKTELFNTELQAYNASIIDGLRKGVIQIRWYAEPDFHRRVCAQP